MGRRKAQPVRLSHGNVTDDSIAPTDGMDPQDPEADLVHSLTASANKMNSASTSSFDPSAAPLGEQQQQQLSDQPANDQSTSRKGGSRSAMPLRTPHSLESKRGKAAKAAALQATQPAEASIDSTKQSSSTNTSGKLNPAIHEGSAATHRKIQVTSMSAAVLVYVKPSCASDIRQVIIVTVICTLHADMFGA